MARKGSLIGSIKAAADQVAAEGPKSSSGASAAVEGPMTTTAIHIPKATLSLLRRVAVARADDKGGRPSVSAVLASLVEKARSDLEREIADTAHH